MIRREFLSGSQLVFPSVVIVFLLLIEYILVITAVLVLCFTVYVIPSTALLLYVTWHW